MTLRSTLLPLFGLFLIACGSSQSRIDRIKEQSKIESTAQAASDVPASARITLKDKGVGSIKDLPLPETIDQAMVDRGAAIFETNCSACHKIEKRFIGPSPKGIMTRRSPEWIMNMILDPQLMVEQDRCAKDMLIEFNGAAMANQNMTEEQARDILEYFRTL
ncbi:MAG: cytochrome c [Bacteroidota bacterium]